jgi:SAM-dependent methyltransferase
MNTRFEKDTRMTVVTVLSSWDFAGIAARVAASARALLDWEVHEETASPTSAPRQGAVIACGPAAAALAGEWRAAGAVTEVAGIDLFDGTEIGRAADALYDTMLRRKWTVGMALLDGDALVATAERGFRPVSNAACDIAFVDVLASRLGQRWHRTELAEGFLSDKVEAPTLATVYATTRRWASLGLFPAYQPEGGLYPGAEFGFVAVRTLAGTLITARGSNKAEAGIDDFALVTGIDDDGTIRVVSSGKKASLNAPLAVRIFEARPEINWIAHLHAFVEGPKAAWAERVTAPGSEDDWAAVADLVEDGAEIINQPMHGCLILLDDSDHLERVLLESNLYNTKSSLYDLAYARFQSEPGKPTHFDSVVDRLEFDRPRQAMRVLDLCCGTGASALSLRAMGFADVTLADGSPTMLAVAEERLGRRGAVVDLADLSPVADGAYDLVTMRQAFNYVPPDGLAAFLFGIAEKLAPGGRFVFNTFERLPAGRGPAREHGVDGPARSARTVEANEVTAERVLHVQRTEVIDLEAGRWDAVIDANAFYQHDLSAVVEALHDAGFAPVALDRSGRSVTLTATLPTCEEAEPLPEIGLDTFLKGLAAMREPDDEFLSSTALRQVLRDVRDHARRLVGRDSSR